MTVINADLAIKNAVSILAYFCSCLGRTFVGGYRILDESPAMKEIRLFTATTGKVESQYRDSPDVFGEPFVAELARLIVCSQVRLKPLLSRTYQNRRTILKLFSHTLEHVHVEQRKKFPFGFLDSLLP